VRVEDETVAELGPGEFFGEMAALEWGAGFAYPRLATVVTASSSRLLVFPDGSLNELTARFPSIDRVVRETVHRRLAER
jgi:aromatic-L-amino-acid/L-tryptophan decarboxylase